MSRFYDALKQASRLHRSHPESPDEFLERFSVDDITVLPEPQHVPLHAGPSESLQATPPEAKPWVVQPEVDAHHYGFDPQNGLAPAAAATVNLDRRARIIPNIADHAVVEHYRRLRTKLMQQHSIKPFRTLMITSPNPQEGKTVTTMNLALSYAMLPSFRVAVVDGDLRRGSLGKWLSTNNNQPGLSNLIDGSAGLDDVVFRCEEIPIHFIVAGRSTVPPAELLHSQELGGQLRKLVESFDLVLVDSPPVNLITDAQLLAANCDAVLLVARAFSTTSKSLQKAVQDLAPFRVIGSVLNGSTRAQLYRRYQSYY